MKNISVLFLASALLLGSFLVQNAGAAGAAPAPASYEIGGPLAGLKLPPNPRGGWGEVDLYPGSVEHYRAEFFRYTPTRSFFDAQSQLKNWVVPNLPGAAGKPVEQFAPPIYTLTKWSTGPATGQFQPAVPVIRIKANDPVFQLDLGELPPGLYAVRVIAAAETAKLRPWRAPVYFALQVNDGLQGETTTYRVRSSYVDDFYSVAELYFHAPERRRYQAKLYLDRGSTVDLLVHNITLDDVLAGYIRRPIKQRQTLTTPATIAALKLKLDEDRDLKKWTAQLKLISPEQRLARDEAIWKWLPPLNAQGVGLTDDALNYTRVTGTADKTGTEIASEYGVWDYDGWPNHLRREDDHGDLGSDPATWNNFIIDKRLGLRYTIDDLWAHKSLPDPYPYKDDGAGLFVPDPANPMTGRELHPIADQISWRYMRQGVFERDAALWLQTGNADLGRDAAVSLVRFAYQYPSLDAANMLDALTFIGGRDLRFRQREGKTEWTGYYSYPGLMWAYDAIFPFIQGNEDLAKSIHRFVPEVRTSQDVIQLLDTYLVQTLAKRLMRYHDITIPAEMAQVATTLADNSVTDPWMDWLFTKAFEYPLRLAGIQDLMVSATDRNGPQYIGSAHYADGEGAAPAAAELEPYINAGGNPKFDLSDPVRYPKPLAHCYWQLLTTIGGMDFCRIGDVTGPDKAPGMLLRSGDHFRHGWKWSKGDPKFAWLLANLYGRKGETDAEWARIEAAAATVKRAPYLDLRSRQLYNWFGALETGLEHDDYRFRRAAYVRTGLGYGHEHNDTLDLQVFEHGLPMTVDGGQRRAGYSSPGDRFSRVHNVVEVDGGGEHSEGLHSQSWVQTISDAEGARYLQANAMPPASATLFRRQTALIDVDEGTGAQPVPAELQKPGAKLPAGVTTPNSYVFDVCRVAGGALHTYCFHGMVQDDFAMNARNVKPVAEVTPGAASSPEAKYLDLFQRSVGQKFAGDAPDTLEATWRYTRDGKMGSEQQMLGKNYDETSPRKFTTLHLLDAAGLRVLQAEMFCKQFGYHFTCLMAQKRGKDLQSAFPAIIEPYVGEPFLAGEKLLDIPGNETDALRAVAVEVKTKNGHTDVCFADGRPEKIREVSGQRSAVSRQESKTGGRASLRAANVRVSGEFAYCSTDTNGLRQAALTGGTLLETPAITIKTAARERTGKVTSVDYLKKTFHVDVPWPAASAGRVFEIGSPARVTSYTATKVVPDKTGTKVGLTEGADYYRSEIDRVDSATSMVACGLVPTLGTAPGLDKGWVASNDRMTKFWRVTKMSGNQFWLNGPVAEADFAPENALRLWEYGVGDTVRQTTFISVRRTAPGEYEVQGDVDAEIVLGGKTHRVTAADLAKNGGKIRLKSGN